MNEIMNEVSLDFSLNVRFIVSVPYLCPDKSNTARMPNSNMNLGLLPGSMPINKGRNNNVKYAKG